MLPAFAEVDSDNKLREVDPLKFKTYEGKTVAAQGAEIIVLQDKKSEDGKSGSKVEEVVKPADIGIVVHGKQDVNDWLDTAPVVQVQLPPEKKEDDSYYSDEEEAPKPAPQPVV